MRSIRPSSFLLSSHPSRIGAANPLPTSLRPKLRGRCRCKENSLAVFNGEAFFLLRRLRPHLPSQFLILNIIWFPQLQFVAFDIEDVNKLSITRCLDGITYRYTFFH